MLKITPRVKIVIGFLLFIGFTNLLSSENSARYYSLTFSKISLFHSGEPEVLLETGAKQEVLGDAYKNAKISHVTEATSSEVPVVSIDLIEDISCFGEADGSIDISVTGGAGSYTYSWSRDTGNFASTSKNISGLSPGNYVLQVTDSNLNKVQTEPISLNDPEILEMASSTSTPVNCFGGSDGTIIAGIVTGGNGGYLYSRDGVSFSSSNTFTGLAAGNYTITIKDSKNCTTTQSITVTQPAALSVAAGTSTPVSCNGGSDGTITAGTVTGGNGGYLYSRDGISFSSSNTFTGLAAGNYTITIKDAKNCTTTQSITVTQPTDLSAAAGNSTPISCNGGRDGTIAAGIVTGGNGGYLYSRDGVSFSSSNTFTGLAAGNYTITIKDAKNCTTTQSITVTQPTALSAAAGNSTPISCSGGSDGTITAGIVTGGNSGYLYSRDGVSFSNSNTFSGLAAGNYTITIKDAKNCTTTQSITVTQPTALSAAAGNSTPISCSGGSDGTITAGIVTGGNSGYLYSKDGVSFSNSNTFSGLTAGNYTITIKDAKNCQISQTVTISQPAILNATLTSTNVTCFGGNNGVISITNPSGGYGTYQYSINNGTSWQDSGSFTGIVSGTYDVIIRDKANPACQLVLRSGLLITQPTILNAAVTSSNVTCNGSNDGNITIFAPSGGFGTYQYSINNGSSWQDSGNFTALNTGNFSVMIRDRAQPSCFVVLNSALAISQPAAINMAEPTSTLVNCFGGNTGTITAGAMSGGNGTFLYSLDNINFQSQTTFSGLTAGMYTMFVKDSKGCAFQKQVTVGQVEKLNVSVSKNDVLCFGGSSGRISLSNPTGGGGTFDYRIGSQPWQTGLIFDNLPIGSYTISIRDRANPTCIISLPAVQILQPAAALTTEVTSKRTTTHGTSTGSANANPSGGTGPYTYIWRKKDNSAILQNTQLATNLPAGWYTVTVIDKNNCEVNKDVRVIDKVTAQINAPSVCENINNDFRTSTFSVDYTTVLGGFEDPTKYTYTWNFGAGIKTITPIADKYKVEYLTGGDKIITLNIKDEANVITTLTFQHYVGECFEGCGSSNNFTIDQNNFYFGDVNGVPINSNNCSTTSEKYLWINITKSSNVYTITGEIEYNINDGTQTIARKAMRCFGTLLSGTPGGNGNNNKPVYSQIGTGLFRLFQVVPGSTNGTSINWSCGQTFNIERINLRYTNQESKECGDNSQNMCIGLTDNIVVSTPIIATTISENIKCNGTNTGSITINASGGIKPYKYSRTGDVIGGYQDSNIFLNLPAGTYNNLWVKDTRDRTLQLPTVVISAPPILESSTTQVNATCFGGLGQATVSASGGTPFSSGATYKYLWNNGITTATATNLPAGNYTVTVIDANNCQILKTVTITQPAQLTVPNAGPDQTFNCGFTSATLSANTTTVGIGQWSISDGTGGTLTNAGLPNSSFSGLAGQQYTLRWTIANTANTCSAFDEMIVTFASNCSTLDFDGVDDYITFGNNYGFTSGNFTLEAWVKLKSTTGTRTILSKRNSASSGNNGYDLVINSGAPTFRWGNNLVTTSNSLNTSRWYHIAVIFDGTKASLYVDGIFMANGNGNNPSSNSHPFLIAATHDAGRPEIPQNYFHGWIEEVRLWKSALSEEQLRFMMNQRLQTGNGTAPVRGEILPMDVPSGLSWDELVGYYQLIGNQVTGGLTLDKASVKINGQVKNVISTQENSAPLPYRSRIDGQAWGTDNTWEEWEVRDAPNSIGINNSPINWNIVETNHNISSGGKDITVLGLKSNTLDKILKIAYPGVDDEDNQGQMLRVTHYLLLNGNIDLVGKSQLLQDEGSILDNASQGWLEIKQQGTKSSYNYNYWSSPVSVQKANNNSGYSVGAVLGNPKGTLSFLPGPYAADGTSPTANNIVISSYWLNAFFPANANDYSRWKPIAHNIPIRSGEGFTMKGTSGAAPISQKQTYSFRGKPHNGTIELAELGANQNYLIGNPYPSAIDGHKFIEDNIDVTNGTNGNPFDGSLYFWDHYGGASHILKEYVGGYAVLNLTSPEGVRAASTDERINNTTTNFESTKEPGQFIPVGQAFMINSTNPEETSTVVFGGNIQFKNSQRVYKRAALDAYTTFLKPETGKASSEEKTSVTKRIRLSFKSPIGYNRQILAGAISTTTNGFDLGYDAQLFDYNLEDMYWIQDKNYLVIQGVQNFDKDQVLKLGVRIKKNKPFRIKLDTLENGPASMKVFLNDKLQDSIHDLRDSPYISSSDAGEINDRFEIVFYKEVAAAEEPPIVTKPDPGIPDGSGQGGEEVTTLTIRYSHTRQEVQILNPDQVTLSNMYIFDLNGNQLFNQWNISHEKDVRIPVRNYSSGVYIVKLHSEDNVISKKFIINN